MNAIDILNSRGFIKQTIYHDQLIELVERERVTFYVGFDPTADSLHIGHYTTLMAMTHMQRAGHRPIILIGGGTAMVGDPTDRNDMRSMMTKQTIAQNVAAFRTQLSKFLSFEGENGAIIVDNAEWLTKLNYIDFIRDIGVHFSVNRMLTADCFRTRMEKGLSFLEFNYMLMQGYDYLELFNRYGCKLQMGGNDQWSNILAGVDLIRRVHAVDAFAATFTLLETSDGKKMGKTQKGAIWLDAKKTSEYDFYQYFRNVEDAKVGECLRLLTFLDEQEIRELTARDGEYLNQAKKVLAYEVTRLVHGDNAALDAQKQAVAAFSGDFESMPTLQSSLTTEASIVEIMEDVGLAKSRSEARRLIEGKGVKIGDQTVQSPSQTAADFTDDATLILHKGKKVHVKILLGKPQ